MVKPSPLNPFAEYRSFSCGECHRRKQKVRVDYVLHSHFTEFDASATVKCLAPMFVILHSFDTDI